MNVNLVITIVLAILLMGIVIAGLAVGLLLTGKSRLRRGCGLTPGKKKKDGTACSVCGEKKECTDEKDNDEPTDNAKTD